MRKMMVLCIWMSSASVALSQTSAVVNVTATVVSGANTISVTPNSIDFGVLMPSIGDRRFLTSALTCEFFVATSPWSIEVSTINPNDVEGMVSPAGDTMPEFKFHQANFGAINPGDEEDDNIWKGDLNAMPPIDPLFKRIFSSTNTFKSTLGSSASQDASPIEFTFAVEAIGVVATNYSADVLFEFAVE